MLAQVLEAYPDDVRLVYRHFPLISIHDNAALATQAAEAAGLQGEFWKMHDLLFETQSEWSAFTPEQFEDWLVDQAASLDLDADQFAADLVSEPLKAKAQQAWDHNVEIGLSGTPFMLINQDIWPSNLPMTFGTITSIVELKLLEKRQFTSCPPMTLDPLKKYTATLKTERGDILIQLFPDVAPLAVNNFIFLSRNGWYDNVTFHRVLPGFVAQSGDPSGTGYGGPGYAFSNEVSSNVKFDKPGVVGMANAGKDTNGSQFFITYAPTPNLDGGYTIFGQVISGMDVAEKLAPRDPSMSADLPPGDLILSIAIEEQ